MYYVPHNHLPWHQQIPRDNEEIPYEINIPYGFGFCGTGGFSESHHVGIKFIHSEKATTYDKISILVLDVTK